MGGFLRKRFVATIGNSPETPTTSHPSNTDGESQQQRQQSQSQAQSPSDQHDSKTGNHTGSTGIVMHCWKWMSILQWIMTIFLSIMAIGTFGMGFVWRMSLLHTGQECDMTYSRRVFVEIPTLYFERSSSATSTFSSKATRHYKLYKFVDARDPRYVQLLLDQKKKEKKNYQHDKQLLDMDSTKEKDDEKDTLDHCSVHNSTIVLYIPGHWGSYDQARSVGAHGTTMTGSQQQNERSIQRALKDGIWTGKASHLDQFVYEVYTVDFAEQGGALHGRFLELQSDYVAHVIQYLSVGCDEIMI